MEARRLPFEPAPITDDEVVEEVDEKGLYDDEDEDKEEMSWIT